MANYSAEDDINFLSNFAKAEHMNYMGESCILVSHNSVEKTNSISRRCLSTANVRRS